MPVAVCGEVCVGVVDSSVNTVAPRRSWHNSQFFVLLDKSLHAYRTGTCPGCTGTGTSGKEMTIPLCDHACLNL